MKVKHFLRVIGSCWKVKIIVRDKPVLYEGEAYKTPKPIQSQKLFEVQAVSDSEGFILRVDA